MEFCEIAGLFDLERQQIEEAWKFVSRLDVSSRKQLFF